MEGNLTLSEVFTLITAEGKCKLCRLFYRGMCGPHCCVISLIKAIPPGLLFGKAKEKYPKLSEPPPFLFPIFIINKKRKCCLGLRISFTYGRDLEFSRSQQLTNLPSYLPPAFPVCSLYFPALRMQKECMGCFFLQVFHPIVIIFEG